MSRLVIIGNGFDRFHDILSGYGHFADYLANTDPQTLRIIERYFGVDKDFWNCFEERLAEFDADSVMEDASQFLMSYGADDWSDSGHHDYEYEIDRVVFSLTTELYKHFGSWIRSLSIPDASCPKRLRTIDPAAFYLTFNYTPTLETVYNVPQQNILHIHGSASDPLGKLVLGHGWNPTDRPRLAACVDEDTDVRVAGGYDQIDDYFSKTFKPTAQIVADNQAFLDGLAAVTEIHVLGHSLSDVDEPYISAIIDRIDQDRVAWWISYHSDPNEPRGRFERYGINPALVQYLPLDSF